MAKPQRRNAKPPGYKPGDIYSFKTSPFTEFSPSDTGRYAALKILHIGEIYTGIAVLDGIFDSHPSFEIASGLKCLINHRARFAEEPEPATRFINHCSDNDLLEFQYLGSVTLSYEDDTVFRQTKSFSGWISVSDTAEGEWRWTHDRETYEKEIELRTLASKKRFAAQRERYLNRLKKLTWEEFIKEKPFPNWDTHPPQPFIEVARNKIRDVAFEIQALGAKPKKADVRAALKACVEWFNAKDEEFGNVIETVEAENIFSVLEELTHLARQKSLVEEIDEWRDW